jgi:hypothetical protein
MSCTQAIQTLFCSSNINTKKVLPFSHSSNSILINILNLQLLRYMSVSVVLISEIHKKGKYERVSTSELLHASECIKYQKTDKIASLDDPRWHLG